MTANRTVESLDPLAGALHEHQLSKLAACLFFSIAHNNFLSTQ